MENTLESSQRKLVSHPVYQKLDSLENLRTFMEYHVFAVWDFMTLLKSLQRQITAVTIPWRPSPYSSELVRLINQIVLGEESDLDAAGRPCSHFELYLRAMKEVGADTSPMEAFLQRPSLEMIPLAARDFVRGNLELAEQGHLVEVAAAFFYGRGKLIPEMFTSITEVLRRENVEAPTLLYYLQRHIDLDGDEHGPLAQKCLHQLTGEDATLKELSLQSGLQALRMREKLWDNVLTKMV